MNIYQLYYVQKNEKYTLFLFYIRYKDTSFRKVRFHKYFRHIQILVFPALIYYQGLLEGRQHAIKRCFEKSCPERSSDFENEIRFIPRLQHKNIVKLLGYCKHEKERILVYEYMPKKSLDKFIFGMFSISQTLLLLYIYLIVF